MLVLPMSIVYAKTDKNDKFIAVSGEALHFYDGVPEYKFPGNKTTGNFIWSQTGSHVTWMGGITANGTSDFTIIYIKPIWEGYNIVDMHTSTIHVVNTLTDPIIGGVQYYGELTISGSGHGTMASWRILGGTGDLANVHGQGTSWSTEEAFTVGYEGWIHFDP